MWLFQSVSLLVLYESITRIDCANVLFIPHLWASSHIAKHLHYGSILNDNGFNATVLCQPLPEDMAKLNEYKDRVATITMNLSKASAAENSGMMKVVRVYHRYPAIRHLLMTPFGFPTRESCIMFYKYLNGSEILLNTLWDLIIVDDPFTSCWSILAAMTNASIAIMSVSFGYGADQLQILQNNPAVTQYGLYVTDYRPKSFATRGLVGYPLGNAWSTDEHHFLTRRVRTFFQNYPASLDQPKPLSHGTSYICCEWSTDIVEHSREFENYTVLVAFGHTGVPVGIAAALFTAMNRLKHLRFIVQGRATDGTNVLTMLVNESRPLSHVTVEMWVSQKTILRSKTTGLFITHGGISSIQEAIEAGVPMMVVPQDWDQFVNAVNVERNGLGIRTTKMNSYHSKDWESFIQHAIIVAAQNSTQLQFDMIRSCSKYSIKYFVWQVRMISNNKRRFVKLYPRCLTNIIGGAAVCSVLSFVLAGMHQRITKHKQMKQNTPKPNLMNKGTIFKNNTPCMNTEVK